MNSWLEKKTSLYCSHADNYGYPATYRHVLFEAVDIPHINRYKHQPVVDRKLITELRQAAPDRSDYKTFKLSIKSQLYCFTPAGLLLSKKKGNVIVLERTGIMQLDFDYNDIKHYDIDELKQAVFDLPFVGYCGLSATGVGFYALVLIAEPERLSEYAEHCFKVLQKHGIKADESKGKKVENLRYVSLDEKALVREYPEVLKINSLKIKSTSRNQVLASKQTVQNGNKIVSEGINRIENAMVGGRWQTIQQVAFTLGGLMDTALLDQIKQAIKGNSQFQGEEEKYCTCAEVCFKAGSGKPLNKAA